MLWPSYFKSLLHFNAACSKSEENDTQTYNASNTYERPVILFLFVPLSVIHRPTHKPIKQIDRLWTENSLIC